MFCNKCGAQLADSAAFSNQCGNAKQATLENGTIRIGGLAHTLGANVFTFTEVDGNTLQLKADTENKLLNLISLNLDYEISLLLLCSFLPVNPHSASTYGKGIVIRWKNFVRRNWNL